MCTQVAIEEHKVSGNLVACFAGEDGNGIINGCGIIEIVVIEESSDKFGSVLKRINLNSSS